MSAMLGNRSRSVIESGLACDCNRLGMTGLIGTSGRSPQHIQNGVGSGSGLRNMNLSSFLSIHSPPLVTDAYRLESALNVINIVEHDERFFHERAQA